MPWPLTCGHWQAAHYIARRGIMVGISAVSYSPYGIACIQCNDHLIAPDWSRYVSERHVRHSWSCERCDHQFETSDYLWLNMHPG